MMDSARIFEVLRITLPVFGVIGIGNFLSRRNIMNEDHQRFLNDLAYYLSLPALIFVELASQPFYKLLDSVLIFSTLISISIIFILYSAGALIFRLKGGLAAAVIFGTYWANVTYMGFPLASSAFGIEQGLAKAAIINAFSIPVFVAVSFIMIGFTSERGQRNIVASVRNALLNPVILAALTGLAVAWIISALKLNSSSGSVPLPLKEAAMSAKAFLRLVGTMGLPLALLAVGGKLRIKAIGRHFVPLSFTVLGKLILLPLITIAVFKLLFPAADKMVAGVAVLLMATPVAVATSVVSSKFKVEEQFVSSLLAVSTILSIITIPLWLYFIL